MDVVTWNVALFKAAIAQITATLTVELTAVNHTDISHVHSFAPTLKNIFF